jgi:hypothetical protein
LLEHTDNQENFLRLLCRPLNAIILYHAGHLEDLSVGLEKNYSDMVTLFLAHLRRIGEEVENGSILSLLCCHYSDHGHQENWPSLISAEQHLGHICLWIHPLKSLLDEVLRCGGEINPATRKAVHSFLQNRPDYQLSPHARRRLLAHPALRS